MASKLMQTDQAVFAASSFSSWLNCYEMFCQCPQPAHLLPADDLDLDGDLHGGHLDGVLPQLHHGAHRLQQEEEDGGRHDRRGRGRYRHQPHPSY